MVYGLASLWLALSCTAETLADCYKGGRATECFGDSLSRIEEGRRNSKVLCDGQPRRIRLGRVLGI